MPGSIPTFKTLQDIQDLGNQFRARCQSALQQARENLGLVNHYILIQDPAYPDDPTKRTWHPNMLAFYSQEDLARILTLCNKFDEDSAFWEKFVVTETVAFETLFNTTKKLDNIVAMALTGHISD